MYTELLKQILVELRRLNGQKFGQREIFSVEQAADYLGLSTNTLREWIRMRKIPFFKVNGSIKFRKSRLDRWIDKSEVSIKW